MTSSIGMPSPLIVGEEGRRAGRRGKRGGKGREEEGRTGGGGEREGERIKIEVNIPNRKNKRLKIA